MKKLFLLAIAIVLVLGGAVVYSIISRGLSTHDEPSRVEEVLARSMRHWATPRATRGLANPVAPTTEVITEALEHYADHCAPCHGNNGSGDTEIGRRMYPRVPDMRAAATQSLSDGELFSIIEHGVRLTGMPGWGDGTPESERESWALVHFIRRLSKLTDEDVARIESLGPKTPAQLKEEEESRRFLEGKDGKDGKDEPSHEPSKPHKHEKE